MRFTCFRLHSSFVLFFNTEMFQKSNYWNEDSIYFVRPMIDKTTVKRQKCSIIATSVVRQSLFFNKVLNATEFLLLQDKEKYSRKRVGIQTFIRKAFTNYLDKFSSRKFILTIKLTSVTVTHSADTNCYSIEQWEQNFFEDLYCEHFQ